MALSIRWAALACAAFMSLAAFAGPSEDANALVDRWSAAYSSNDVDAIVALYAPNAVLLGTVSPVMSEGSAAIGKYFSAVKGTGNKNAIRERRVFLLDDNAVVVTGFYDFSNSAQPPVVRPSRFTMLVTRQGDEWRISHHHSSPLVPPK